MGHKRPEQGLCAVGDHPALSSAELGAQRPCQGPVQENSLAVQVLSRECSLFVQQILSLSNAFEVCRMGQVMQSLRISTEGMASIKVSR